MTGRWAVDDRWVRGVALTFALLALIFKIAVPPGFMVGARGAPLLMFCEAQAPLLVAVAKSAAAASGAHHHHHMGGGTQAPEPAKHTTGDCPFAGHATSAAATVVIAFVPVTFAAYAVDLPRLWRGVAVGAGLCAPPMPARGPPL